MKPTGTKFKTADGKQWEIINSNNGLYYTCICRDRLKHEFKDFREEDLKGVEFYE